MMAQAVPHQTTDKKRVKVYELRNNDWFDRGTGFCTAEYVTADEGQPGQEPRVSVEAEDSPGRWLLETKIIRDDGFQKQQDTLIVWTDNGVDMALSFQEADCCQEIWKFIDGVQQTFQSVNGAHAEDVLSDELAIDMTATIQLAPPELGNLAELENQIRIMNSTGNGRDALTKAIMNDQYINKLIPLVDEAEDLESLADLHKLCNIMKMILLLNDSGIIEHAVSDECVLGVVGALEYDPDFPSHKANHRQWLGSQGRYKEVVKIEDEQIRRKIHQTYRLQYLKDVVLARILDDPTFSVLNSLIFFNQVDIVQHLQSNTDFLKALFGIFPDPNENLLRKKNAVLFIQQCCAIAKSIQPQSRQTLYGNFLTHGLHQVISFGLRNFDVTVRVGATDILISMIDHDPQMIRHAIFQQIRERQLQSPLIDTLIDLLLVETDLGIRSQVSDSLKVLLDPVPTGPPQEVRGDPTVARGRVQQPIEAQQDVVLTYFYEHSAIRLFKPLLDLETRVEIRFSVLDDGIFTYLSDILCFYIRQHANRSKFFIMQHNLAQRFVQLLSCKQKHLQLVAIRFIRQLVVLQEEFYIRHLVEKNVLGPVLDVLLRTMPRDNLLSSACLELFALIAKENIRDLNKHLVENYREKIMALAYIDTFRDIIARYDHAQGYPATVDPYFLESEDEPGSNRRPTNTGGRGMIEQLVVDPSEEEYWNTSDDEDTVARTTPATTNGTKPLVEYTSDEEAEDAVMGSATTLPADQESKENKDPVTPSTTPSSATTPPERVSEKRRREEDEDDALDQLVQHKRRNSSAASSNASISPGLRKKKSLVGARDAVVGQQNGNAPTKRISITISSSIKNSAAVKAGSGEEEGK